MEHSTRKRKNGVAAVDVDAAEMKGYLNTKKEMIYKSIIWELLNKKYSQGNTTQNQKPKKQPKKEKNAENDVVAAAAKRKERAHDDDEIKCKKMEEKRQRLSSKVNFDVLDEQEDDGDEGCKEKKNENEIENEHGDANEENYDDQGDDFGDVNTYHGIGENEEQGYNFDDYCDHEDY